MPGESSLRVGATRLFSSPLWGEDARAQRGRVRGIDASGHNRGAGTPSRQPSPHRGEGVRRATLLLCLALCFGLGAMTGPANAEKVGVAAAVNPDAFSSLAGKPQTQLNIGKSIFYNERINTTASGLVQVLLVDGSTFTVGPGSDLVIDSFVYDPKKKAGQITASFSKGVMRFVGGKISKNEGGVIVNTPAGALAIRGGIAYVDFKSPKTYSILFVFGEYLKLQGQTLFQQGYGWFVDNGQWTTRPFNATDLAAIMASLTNSNTTGLANNSNNGPKPTTLLSTQSLNQLIADANTTQIQGEIDEQLANQESGQPTTNLSQGYAAGIFQQQVLNQNGEPIGSDNSDPPIGTLSNLSPSEVALLFNGPGGTFSGASFSLFVDAGFEGEGGAKIVFSPIDVPSIIPGGLPEGVELFAGGATSEVSGAITVYDKTILTPTGPQLSDPAQLNFGEAVLVGVSGQGQAFCESCNFLKWGAWLANLDFQTNQGVSGETPTHQVQVAGWFVSGDLPTIGQLPTRGTATYAGTALGTAAIQNCEGWQTFVASGNVNMTWDFRERSGTLAISNFTGPTGPETQLPVLNVSGTMNMPGQLSEINKFSGPLGGTSGGDPISGNAVGSFAANGTDRAAGVIGNFNAGNDTYRASGVFGAGPASTDNIAISTRGN